jgi:molecular chaperone IbpA
MRHFDLTPLYRSTVGFDRLFRMLDDLSGYEAGAPSYPPYNIERTGENAYRITMAVAGFAPDEIEVVATPNLLTISGHKAQGGEEGVQYLHRGIATRSFKRTFELADYVKVADAKLDNGLLMIELVREVPEAMKPRRIEIKAGEGKQPQQIEHSKAA